MMANYPQHVKEKLMEIIKKVSQEKELHVFNPATDFTRKRKLNFEKMLLLLHTLSTQTLTYELMEYFDFELSETPTSSAFIQQREKIKISAFDSIFKGFVKEFYPHTVENDYKILAVDGTDINIAYNPNCKRSFNQSLKDSRGYNQLHLTALFDLKHKMYLDFVIQGKREHNEYKALNEIVDHSDIGGKVLLLADRGFESYNVFEHINKKGWNYAIRVKDIYSNGICSSFELPDGEFDITVEKILTRKQTKLTKGDRKYKFLPSNSHFDFFDDTQQYYPIRLRIVRFKISTDTYETLITNLNDKEYCLKQFKELYNMRWGIETGFREIKHTVGLEFFHSKKIASIIQEIYAKFTLYNFCEIITHSVVIEQKSKLYTYQVNFTLAIKACLRYFRLTKDATFDLIALIAKHNEPIRPNRSFKRKGKSAVQSFSYRVTR